VIMRLLLDTHAFIWFVENDEHLPLAVKEIIENPKNEIFLSIASIWEMAIKIQLKKLNINKSIEDIIELTSINYFQLLPIMPNHIVRLSTLSFFHRDPFDRIIIAQGLYEKMSIVGRDLLFDDYKVKRIWG
jgi:PIN domain nuclease of toxin-antitoxin system